MIIALLKLFSGPDDALLETERLICHQIRNYLFNLSRRISRIFESGFQEVGLGEIGIDGLGRLYEEVIEICPTPLDGIQYISDRQRG